MCGICGIISINSLDIVRHIKTMSDSLRHRGPDDEGFSFFDTVTGDYWMYGGNDTPEAVYKSNNLYTPNCALTANDRIAANFVLGHRRLSIIDLSPAGHQPMCTEDQRYWSVYNGEIYNYVELRDQLKKLGFQFHSNSDTEVLLNSYAHWGMGALNRFVGMFTFAIYDRPKGRVFLARDFFGIKPLYYCILPDGLAFASEIKALLVIPQIKKTVNPQRLFDYLYRGMTDHGGETLLSGICQVPAAHYLYIDLNNLKLHGPFRYWDIDRKKENDISFAEASSHMQKLFLKNVKLHLRSDVAVGAALSGGIDSSSIVMAMRQIQGYELDLFTFSHIVEDPKVCEEKWVDIIGSASASKVHKLKPTADELLVDLDSLMYHQDEPFGSTSIYAQYRIMRLAKENKIKVMLDGQGADEVLAGYSGYFGARMASLIRNQEWKDAFRFYSNSVRTGNLQWQNFIMQTCQFFLPDFLIAPAKKAFNVDLVTSWLNNRWFKERQVDYTGYQINRNRYIMRERLYESMTQGGLNSLLRYEDRNSMAFSIESRVPFLTPELTNFLFSLPEKYILDMNGTSKYVFRQAMRGIVPDAVLDRKDKIGFATPELEWLKSLRLWTERLIDGEIARNIPVVNINKFKVEWNDVLSGKAKFDWRIWWVINLIKWVEHIDAHFD
ncbi:MAG: asparagine synthase (glutamine-hydrolyzing) [Nitrospinales bacterium]